MICCDHFHTPRVFQRWGPAFNALETGHFCKPRAFHLPSSRQTSHQPFFQPAAFFGRRRLHPLSPEGVQKGPNWEVSTISFFCLPFWNLKLFLPLMFVLFYRSCGCSGFSECCAAHDEVQWRSRLYGALEVSDPSAVDVASCWPIRMTNGIRGSRLDDCPAHQNGDIVFEEYGNQSFHEQQGFAS